MKSAIFKCLSIILLLSTTLAIMCSCGNMDVTGIGSFTFKHVHVSTHQKAVCYTVEKWVDGSSGIEVKTAEAGPMFLSEGTYILYHDEKDCAFCHPTEVSE